MKTSNKSEEEIQAEIQKKVFELDRERNETKKKVESEEIQIEVLNEMTSEVISREDIEKITKQIRRGNNSEETQQINKYKNSLPSQVQRHLELLPLSITDEFFEEYKFKSRKIIFSYLLWIFFPLSPHHGYLNHWVRQAFYWITLGGFGAWWIIDFFRIPDLVQEHNMKTAKKILKRLLRKYEKKLNSSQKDFEYSTWEEIGHQLRELVNKLDYKGADSKKSSLN
ncbi:MAG: hypothetical protein ACI86H_001336 [bacterium]|jgi:hypothetical protein